MPRGCVRREIDAVPLKAQESHQWPKRGYGCCIRWTGLRASSRSTLEESVVSVEGIEAVLVSFRLGRMVKPAHLLETTYPNAD